MTSLDHQPGSSSQSTFFRVSASSAYSPDGHAHEFISIIDSLGRIWNSLHHPRDRHGRFIRTFSNVWYSPRGRSAKSTAPTWTGTVRGVDKDGSALLKVDKASPGNPEGVKAGDWVRVDQRDILVKTIKGVIGKDGKQKTMTSGPAESMRKQIESLRKMGLTDQADRMQKALDLGLDENGDNTDAIEIMRGLAEELDDLRGEGYAPGTTTDDLKTSAEKGKAQRLDQAIATLITARHDIGDKGELGFEVDQGAVTKSQSERRQSAAYDEIAAAARAGAKVRDLTATDPAKAVVDLVAPVDMVPRDQVYRQEQQNVLPALRPALRQKAETGKDRMAGYRQRQQVAPKDRAHVDKNGDDVFAGSVVNVDAANRAGTTRQAFTGLVTRIHTNASGKKQLRVRDFDPTRTDDKSYVEKGYKDYWVDSKSLELAPDDTQDERFKNLAMANQTARSLVDTFSTDYIEALRKRYSSPGAKKLSWSQSIDLMPPDKRQRTDKNGQAIRIGDHVADQNGAVGLVTNISPNDNTVVIQYPNSQAIGRVTASKLTKAQGPTSKTSLQSDAFNGGGDFMPTRDEASAYARSIGADSVANAIENDGDYVEIQDAMASDQAFQDALAGAQDLWTERDSTLASGQEPSQELIDQLAVWDALAVASAGQFREPSQVVDSAIRPKKPQPVEGVEDPQDPTNPDRVVTPNGSTIRKDENGDLIVNEDTADPKKTAEEAKQKAEDAAPTQEQAPQEADQQEAAAKTREEMSIAERVVDSLRTRAIGFSTDPESQSSIDSKIDEFEAAVAAGDLAKMLDVLSDLRAQMTTTRAKNSELGKFLNAAGFPTADGQRGSIADMLNARNDDGTLFAPPKAPEGAVERPSTGAEEPPEGVSKSTDIADNELSKSLLAGDGQTFLDSEGNPVETGFAVLEPKSVVSLPEAPTQQDLADLIEETGLQPGQSLSIWQDPDGTYRAGAMSLFETQEDASSYANANEASQFVDISDGQVYNTALPEEDGTVNSVADDRAKDRNVSTSAEGRAKVNGRTSKQQRLAEQIKARTDADPAVAKALDAIIGGDGEISAEEADALSKYVSGLSLDAFEGNNEREKASSKGVAQALADRISQAAGKQDAREYASTNTALRRSSDVSQTMKGALSSYANSGQEAQVEEISSKLAEARQMIKDGNLAGAATLFDQIADLFESVEFNGNFDAKKAGRRAREHAARLRAGSAGAAPAPPIDVVDAPPAPDETAATENLETLEILTPDEPEEEETP